MDGPRDDHSKCSKSDRERQRLYITHMWNLTFTNELVYKTETDFKKKVDTKGDRRVGGIN